ncbi:MAG: rRNA methyltransferase [Candidatus Puniceispirillum sp.]|nr:rRNA methyltransferase [Candidatus Puniceispirillum sp.]
MKPVIILVETQLDQNIGKVARAMLNFDLTDLRLVRPKTEHNNDTARRLSAGAERVLEKARVFDTLPRAAHDLTYLYATTARPRELIKDVYSPREVATRLETIHAPRDERVGFVFGSERCGLENEDIALCKAIVSVPLSREFSSLNLAQAVILLAYECFQASPTKENLQAYDEPPATLAEYEGFFEHLTGELEKAGYFREKNRKGVMTRTLHNMFSRMPFSSQEVRTLRGVVATLVNPQGIYSRPKKTRTPQS